MVSQNAIAAELSPLGAVQLSTVLLTELVYHRQHRNTSGWFLLLPITTLFIARIFV